MEKQTTRSTKRKSTLDLNTMVFAKIPPNAKDLEKEVLGVIMMEKPAFEKVEAILRPECFYADYHQRIFKAFIALKNKGLVIDAVSTVQQLSESEELELIGGAYEIAKLTNSVVSGANIEHYSRIIYQNYIAREIIIISGEAISSSYAGDDPFDLLNTIESKLSRLSIGKTALPFRKLADVAKDALKRIQEIKHSGNKLTGVSSGIREIDVITQGWQATNLIVVAARPSVGKSAVAANFAINATRSPIKPTRVAIFSLEMPMIQWAFRMLASETEIELYDLKRGQVTDGDIKSLESAAYGKFDNVPIWLCDESSLDIYKAKSYIRTLVLKEGVGLVILDYLQLMSGNRQNGENREQEVARISRELKQLAKELNIPIIALSQLSRGGDTSDPKLSNLRESGAIEQDADDVLFLIEVSEDDVKNDASLKDSILIRFAKHRNGTKETIPVRFVQGIQKLMSENDYDRYSRKTKPTYISPANPNRNFEPTRGDYEAPF